jgi:hypothetical protein
MENSILSEISLTDSRSQKFTNKEEEFEFYKNNYKTLEKNLLQYESKIKTLETSNKKLLESLNENKRGGNNTSVQFFLPSEFKKNWENLIGTELLAPFDNCINNFIFISHICQDLTIIVYNETKDLIEKKVDSLLICLGVKVESKEKRLQIISKFIPFFQEHFFEIFQLSKENYQNIKNQLKKKSLSYKIEFNQKDLEESIKDKQFDILLRGLFNVCLHMLLHEPLLTFNILPYEKRKIEYYYYDKSEYQSIEGFGNEKTPCLIILPPPVLRNSFPFNGMKAAAYLIENPTEDMIKQCEINEKDKNKSDNKERKSTGKKSNSDNKNIQKEIIEEKKNQIKEDINNIIKIEKEKKEMNDKKYEESNFEEKKNIIEIEEKKYEFKENDINEEINSNKINIEDNKENTNSVKNNNDLIFNDINENNNENDKNNLIKDSLEFNIDSLKTELFDNINSKKIIVENSNSEKINNSINNKNNIEEIKLKSSNPVEIEKEETKNYNFELENPYNYYTYNPTLTPNKKGINSSNNYIKTTTNLLNSERILKNNNNFIQRQPLFSNDNLFKKKKYNHKTTANIKKGNLFYKYNTFQDKNKRERKIENIPVTDLYNKYPNEKIFERDNSYRVPNFNLERYKYIKKPVNNNLSNNSSFSNPKIINNYYKRDDSFKGNNKLYDNSQVFQTIPQGVSNLQDLNDLYKKYSDYRINYFKNDNDNNKVNNINDNYFTNVREYYKKLFEGNNYNNYHINELEIDHLRKKYNIDSKEN